MLLIPAHIPLRRKTMLTVQIVQTWPEDALTQLQDCFALTDWSVFELQDLQVYTDSVLSYIKFCIDSVTVVKHIRDYPNQKPWMTNKVQSLLRARNSAFKTNDMALYSSARADLRRGIKTAKDNYIRKVEDHLANNIPREVWLGLKHLLTTDPQLSL